MAEQKFFLCTHCKNLVGLIHNAGVPLVCCGEKMQELTANSTDASGEKHVPVATVENGTVHVKIGTAPHPMEEAHFIQFIYLQTQNGGQRRNLVAGSTPQATFTLVDDKPIAVFEYCNLHGLWKLDF